MPTSYTITWPWLAVFCCNNSLSVSQQKTLIWTFRFLPNKFSAVHCSHNQWWQSVEAQVQCWCWRVEMQKKNVDQKFVSAMDLQVVFAFIASRQGQNIENWILIRRLNSVLICLTERDVHWHVLCLRENRLRFELFSISSISYLKIGIKSRFLSNDSVRDFAFSR